MRKRILSLTLLPALLCSLSLTVSAVGGPDKNRTGSISAAMSHDGSPVPGGSLTLFKVADVSASGRTFVYTADFDSCSLPLTQLNSAALPVELAAIAEDRKLEGTTQPLNGQGKAKFSDLQIGLYLLVQKEAAPGYQAVNPFLVSVPGREGSRYIYDVDTAPKNLPEPEPVPTQPTEPKPTEPPKPSDNKLPQTGQTQWPVPVLLAAGVLLMGAGLCLRISGKRKQDEA